MFDMSWGEIMVIGGVALIVIGPKDLPRALRTVGQMTTKVRRMAGEFQSQFSEAMREAELDDVRKEVEGLNRDVTSATSTAFNPIQTIRDELKGSVEQTQTASTGDWTAGQANLTAGLVEEPPIVSAATPPEPDASAPAPISLIDPEAQALVPLPVDEPVLPTPVLPTPVMPTPDLPTPEPAPAVVAGLRQESPAGPEMPREARA